MLLIDRATQDAFREETLGLFGGFTTPPAFSGDAEGIDGMSFASTPPTMVLGVQPDEQYVAPLSPGY